MLQETFEREVQVERTAAPHPQAASEKKKKTITEQAESSGGRISNKKKKKKPPRSPEVESQQICFPFVRQQLCYS